MHLRSAFLAGILLCVVCVLDAQQLITAYSAKDGLPHNSVNALYRDNEGYLWCGTDNGVSVYDGWTFHKPVTSGEKANPNLDAPVHGIIPAADNKTVWVGTESVVMQFDRYSYRVLHSFDMVKKPGVNEIPVYANDTAVWLLCAKNGLYRVRINDGKSARIFSDSVAAVFGWAGDNQTMVFAGEAGDLTAYNVLTNSAKHIALPPAMNMLRINAFMAVPGSLTELIAATDKGLWKVGIASGTAEPFTPGDANYSDREMDVRSLSVHPDGSWWMAVHGQGVFRYDPAKRTLRACNLHSDGSSANALLTSPAALLCDQYGVTWCGTDAGLVKLLHSRLVFRNVAGGNTATYNFGELPDALYTADGLRTSLKLADPAEDAFCFRAPSLLASYGDGDENTGIIRESMVRNYSANDVELILWLTDFAFPGRVLYTHQLQGLDDEPHTERGLRKVSFTSLGSGFYSFVCSAQIAQCGTPKMEKLLTIKIIPPPWESGGFIAVGSMGVVVIATLVLFIVMRTRYKRKLRRLHMQQELDNVRARISRDIHDEIGAGLTRIALSGELLSQRAVGDVQQQEKLKWIAGTARELSQSMKEVVWSVNPHYDSLDHMTAYFRSYVAGVAEQADVRFRYAADENIPALQVNPETRRNLLLILKEAVSNAMKYSGCTVLELEIRWHDPTLTMKIADNGKGFEVDGAEGVNSNGLRNIRQRAWSSHCTATIVSAKGEGTRITIEGPVV